MLTSGVTSQPTRGSQSGDRKQGQRSHPSFKPTTKTELVSKEKKLKHCNLCVFTSEIHLVRWRPVCLLFTLVTGNCDVFERAPVLLVALQCQFLGSVNYITGKTLKSLDDPKKTNK